MIMSVYWVEMHEMGSKWQKVASSDRAGSIISSRHGLWYGPERRGEDGLKRVEGRST